MTDTERFSSQDVLRLLELVTSAARIRGVPVSDVIDSFEQSTLSRPGGPRRPGGFTAEFVKRMRLIRLRRNRFVGAPIFRDPAWDMLLELFAAHHQSRQLSTSSLCYASGVPLSTAIRQLDKLERHGLIVRREDQLDTRQCLVEATTKGLEAVAAVVAELIENFHAAESTYLVPGGSSELRSMKPQPSGALDSTRSAGATSTSGNGLGTGGRDDVYDRDR